jgi:L-threonylcarbamoyladenylate synthase
MAKNDVQCFKDIPEVAWQIIDLSETQPLILDNPRNVAPNIISADKSLGIRIKGTFLL